MGFAVAVVDMAERIGFVDLIDETLFWDRKQCKVSPGQRLLTLMVVILVDPRALYRVAEFYADLDCDVLFGSSRLATDFNDDAIGRALVKLFESQRGVLFERASIQAVERLGLAPSPTAHYDTTTVTLTGDYTDTDAGAQPLRGHNKDAHPERKQLVVGVGTRADGIPTMLDVLDGNTNDGTWCPETVISEGMHLREAIRKDVLFVADSKMVTDAAVDLCCEADIYFVSRLPNTFKLEKASKAAVRERTDWIEGGTFTDDESDEVTQYRWLEIPGEIAGHTLRVIVVHSSALETHADQWVTKQVEGEATWLDQEIADWTQRTFACRADAERAWQQWQARKRVQGSPWSVTGDIGFGGFRSALDGPGRSQCNGQHGGVSGRTVPAQYLHHRLESSDASPRHLLRAYKHQYVIEQDNALVKGPLQIAPVFLKDTKKLEAYVYCVFLALLLWRCMEAVMRVNQARLGITLPYPNQRLQPAPTTKRLKEIIQPVQIIQWRDEAGRPQRRRSELSLVQRQALLLLGMDSRRFTQVPSG